MECPVECLHERVHHDIDRLVLLQAFSDAVLELIQIHQIEIKISSLIRALMETFNVFQLQICQFLVNRAMVIPEIFWFQKCFRFISLLQVHDRN